MESHVTMNMQPEKIQRLKKVMTDLSVISAVIECKNYFKILIGSTFYCERYPIIN